MKKLISLLISLILGMMIGFVLFAYVPLGFRYKYMQLGGGPSFYRVDRFTSEIKFCELKGGEYVVLPFCQA